MSLTIKPVTRDISDNVERLFATDATVNACWCMWFIIPVKDYHALGHEGNHAHFCELLATSEHPLGLLAYEDDEPVGWCAVGPRSRYRRALKTPTYRDTVGAQNATIWLVPCFFIRKDKRRSGISKALLEAAVQLAEEYGASAIDSFPFSRTKGRASGELQVGFESLFAACGFSVIQTPSTSRVVMRRELNGSIQKP